MGIAIYPTPAAATGITGRAFTVAPGTSGGSSTTNNVSLTTGWYKVNLAPSNSVSAIVTNSSTSQRYFLTYSPSFATAYTTNVNTNNNFTYINSNIDVTVSVTPTWNVAVLSSTLSGNFLGTLWGYGNGGMVWSASYTSISPFNSTIVFTTNFSTFTYGTTVADNNGSWSQQNSFSIFGPSYVYTGTSWLTIGTSGFAESTNLTTWTTRMSPHGSSIQAMALGYASTPTQKYVAAWNHAQFYVSTNGTTWTGVGTGGPAGTSVVWDGTYWLLTLSDGSARYSTTGNNGTWNTTGAISASGLRQVVYNSGAASNKLLVLNNANVVYTATAANGSWTSRGNIASALGWSAVGAITVANGYYFMPLFTTSYNPNAGGTSAMALSTDGVTWSTNSLYNGAGVASMYFQNPSGIAPTYFSGSTYYAVAANGAGYHFTTTLTSANQSNVEAAALTFEGPYN